MTCARLLGTVGLIGLLGAFIGCGSKPTTEVPLPGQQPQQDIYELDPAKHAIPAAAATGRLDGKPFIPNRVELEGNLLSFRQGEDDYIVIVLNCTKVPTDGVKLVVRPEEKGADIIPLLNLSRRKTDPLTTPFVSEGYAMTLVLGKIEKGKAAGKIFLALPGAERSYLAGVFTAEQKRALSEPPGAGEVPYIQGSVSPPLKAWQTVRVGYVGIPDDGQIISDSAGRQLFEDGDGGSVRSLSSAPRHTTVRFEKFVPHFDFTNLPPGRYLIYAQYKDGPTGWMWATVAAGATVTADLKLDGSKLGTVEVKVPGDEREVRLVPTDLGSPQPDEQFLNRLSFALDLRADTKDGKATITNVPAGKYQVRAGELWADVKVTAGKTTMVEPKPAKN